jgi:uncharacterized phage protein (TIGR02218 family)
MKIVSNNLAAHLAGEALTMATLWRVVRTDGAIFTFTDHDRDIVYGGETYASAVGYQRAAIGSGATLAVDETELLGMLDSETIDAAALRAGVWDHAEVRIFAVNYASLGDGEIKLRRGWLGEVVARDDGSFRAELRGLAQPLQSTVGSVYQPECRADLGDARCKIDLTYGAGWTQEAEIASVTNSVTLAMDGTLAGFADGWFEGGVVTWQSGDNAGVVREVLAWTQSGQVLQLLAPPPFAPTAGDMLRIQPGCDKQWTTCRVKFANKLNFRGEPLVPKSSSVIEMPA